VSEIRDRLDELAARAGVRALPPRALLALSVAVAGVIGWAVLRSAGGGASQEFAFEETPVAAAPARAESAEDTAPATVVVHIAGAVLHPGVVELPAGSRVGEAVGAAGGPLGTAGLDAVNLARVLSDGEQVYIPTRDEVAAGVAAPPGAAADGEDGSSAGGLVDINSATQAELEELPGVGPATASAIVEERETNGPFSAPEDLMRVSGIGPKKYEALADLVEAR